MKKYSNIQRLFLGDLLNFKINIEFYLQSPLIRLTSIIQFEKSCNNLIRFVVKSLIWNSIYF